MGWRMFVWFLKCTRAQLVFVPLPFVPLSPPPVSPFRKTLSVKHRSRDTRTQLFRNIISHGKEMEGNLLRDRCFSLGSLRNLPSSSRSFRPRVPASRYIRAIAEQSLNNRSLDYRANVPIQISLASPEAFAPPEVSTRSKANTRDVNNVSGAFSTRVFPPETIRGAKLLSLVLTDAKRKKKRRNEK